MVDDFMRRLNDSRLNAWENAKHILERAAEEGRDLSAEEEAAFERANADVNALDERLSSLLDAEKRGADLAEAMRGIESRPVDAPAAAAAPADDLRAFLRGETRALTFKPTVAELRDLTKGTPPPVARPSRPRSVACCGRTSSRPRPSPVSRRC